jgi:phosphoserine phosphatase RsbU/P
MLRLRWKLMILLLAMALGPMAAVVVIDRRATRRLGEQLGQQMHATLLDIAERQLLRAVEDFGRLLGAEKRAVELSVRMQARAAAERLTTARGIDDDAAQPQAIPHSLFDDVRRHPAIPGIQRSPRHVHHADDGTLIPMAVSYEVTSFLLPGGREELDASDAMRRLAAMLDDYRAVRAAAPDQIIWQYTALPDGLQQAYPGHGGYPEDFDPRQRPWYLRAVEAYERARHPSPDAAVTWVPPMVDAATRDLVLTVAAPVVDHAGNLRGVTALDVSMRGLLSRATMPVPWSEQAETLMIIVPRDHVPEQWLHRPLVFASSLEHRPRDWTRPPPLRPLSLDDDATLASVIADMNAPRSNARSVKIDGEDRLLAYGPISDDGMFLAVTLPMSMLLQSVEQAEQHVLTQARAAMLRATFVGVIVAMLAAMIAWFGARVVTRPVDQLADAAAAIADGDLDTRVTIRTHDELEKLGNAFNRMVPKLRDRLRMRDSLALAMQVQQNLLPDAPPRIEGLDIAGRSIYCDETGGDYYDFLDLSDLSQPGRRRLVVAVGDVTGHGVAAAILMATARALLRSRIDHGNELAAVISNINLHLADDRQAGRFMTLLCLLLDVDQRMLTWVGAGHDPVIVYDPGTDAFDELAGVDLPLGVDPTWQYQHFCSDRWQPGMVLLIGTDGIWETRDPDGRQFGKVRLREVLRAHAGEPAQAVGEAIVAAVEAFRGRGPQEDDLTFVVIKLL